MGKIKPRYPVQSIPMLEDIDKSEYKDFGIITSTGIKNAYRLAFAKGEGASVKDATYDKAKHQHTCCGSKVPWRHRVGCKLLKFEDEE